MAIVDKLYSLVRFCVSNPVLDVNPIRLYITRYAILTHVRVYLYHYNIIFIMSCTCIFYFLELTIRYY